MSEKEIMLTKALVRKCDHEHSLLFRALVWFLSPMSDGTQLPVTSVPQNLTLFQPQAPPCKYAQIHTHVCTHMLKGEEGRLEGGQEGRGGRKVEDIKNLFKKVTGEAFSPYVEYFNFKEI